MTQIFYIDGELVSSDIASLPVDDLAILRGYGIFDLTRTYGGKPFRLDAHLARLERSAALLHLELPLSTSEIRAIALDVLARNELTEAILRIIVTGGPSQDNITPEGRSRIMIMVSPVREHPAQWFTEGIKIITNHEERWLPGAKTINYIPAIIALKKAAAADAVDAIYIAGDGRALEGTTTNIFAFYGDRLVTPERDVLHGITRRFVLELAEAEFDVELADLPLSELLKADEVFITSSTKEICPVRQIDETVIGPPGPNTLRLRDRFKVYAPQDAEAVR